MPDRKTETADRKKQALRDNLRRRKAQLRELKGDASLKTRSGGFSPKTAISPDTAPQTDQDGESSA